jgi:hypothetical protein
MATPRDSDDPLRAQLRDRARIEADDTPQHGVGVLTEARR